MSRTVPVPESLSKRLAGGHAWIYRDHFPPKFRARTGQWVTARSGNVTAFGLWDEESPIALRVFSTREVPDEPLIRARVERAWESRRPLREAAGDGQKTTAYRWVFGEGDGLPGMVVDLYGGFAVVTCVSRAVEPVLPWLLSALPRVGATRGVVLRSEHGVQRVSGEMPPADLVVYERGVQLRANVVAGQKTGLFLDHRENRAWLRPFCEGATVLNLYGYTGAFSLAALSGGATQVTTVDASAPALAAAKDNFALNGFDASAHRFVKGDVSDVLREMGQGAGNERFSVVICDPPSFAKDRTQRRQAERAYIKVNGLGMSVTETGGLFAAASCTSQVPPETFRGLLGDAARRARARFQIVHEAGHALDHPVMAGHPESRYLKFVVGRVLREG